MVLVVSLLGQSPSIMAYGDGGAARGSSAAQNVIKQPQLLRERHFRPQAGHLAAHTEQDLPHRFRCTLSGWRVEARPRVPTVT